MYKNKLTVVCLFVLFGNSALAGTFMEDLLHFENAVQFSKFSDSKLEDFKNPLVGKSNFILPEKRAPWAGNYFPMQDGGIANRWQSTNKIKKLEDIPTKEAVLKMTAAEINLLSPVEKYDIVMGDYTFSATRHELLDRGPLRSSKPEDWEGFCNGMRAAGILLPEPKRPITITNADGVSVQLDIADLKALAGASYFYVEKYAQIGSPSSKRAEHQPNAAVFDLALRYFIGEKKKAFAIDTYLGDQIWNESIIGYNRVLSDKMNLSPQEKILFPNAAQKIKVNLTLTTLGEVEIADSNRQTRGDVASETIKNDPIVTAYHLYLDSKGNVIDGKWTNPPGTRGVDFAWFGGGKGMDAAYSTDGQVGDTKLNFDLIRKFFKRASRSMTCKNVYSL